MYLATADLDETGSTAVHLDVTSAVNILAYAHSATVGTPGALWHIFPAEETPRLRQYLREKLKLQATDGDPIHAQRTYLTRSMRAELSERQIRYFEIKQKVGQAIFIPAGCAHQVCELRECAGIMWLDTPLGQQSQTMHKSRL